MIKFKVFDKLGVVVTEKAKAHRYEDLPMKGLGKSLEGVGLLEPVLVDVRDVIDNKICWQYTQAECERRAYELNADIITYEVPNPDYTLGHRLEFWFVKKAITPY